MDNLYIRILDGKPYLHPVTEDNMKLSHTDVSLDVLPDNWAKFVRVEQPALTPYQTATCVYDWDGDVVKDVWTVVDMSEEEKAAKQETVKTNWLADGGWHDWIFDEESCTHKPPIDYPSDDKEYVWDSSIGGWTELSSEIVEHNRPAYPDDGQIYDYDENANVWVLRK